MNVAVHVFYSRKFSRNTTYISALAPALSEHGVLGGIHDITEDAQEWQRLGLRSVPAAVLYVDGVPASDIVSYATAEAVLDRVKAIAQTPPAGPSPPRAHRSGPPAEMRGPFVDYHVEASSGCHRYERWNEELLAEADAGTGWCCPSAGGETEYIIIKLKQTALVSGLLLRPRIRSDGTPSYKSFPKALSVWVLADHGGAVKLWSQDDIALSSVSDYYRISFASPHSCNRLKLVVDDKHDIDGKAFPCIAELRVVGRTDALAECGYILRRANSLYTGRKQPFFKRGLFAKDDVCVEYYSLLEGQRTPACYSNRHKLVIMQSGTAAVLIDEKDRIVLEPGDLITVEPAHSYALLAENGQSAALVVFCRAGLESVWESR